MLATQLDETKDGTRTRINLPLQFATCWIVYCCSTAAATRPMIRLARSGFLFTDTSRTGAGFGSVADRDVDMVEMCGGGMRYDTADARERSGT